MADCFTIYPHIMHLSLFIYHEKLNYKFVCLFDLILYVPSTIFQLNRDGASWVEPVLSNDKCVLLKDHNAVTPVSLEPAAPWTLPLSHCAPYLATKF